MCTPLSCIVHSIVTLIIGTHFTVTNTGCFNIDVSSVIVHQGNNDSYFGYSVALHKDRGVGWLLVGAPRAQTDQKSVVRGGAIYRCSPTHNQACQQILFDPSGSNFINKRGSYTQIDDKSYQWFGSTLQSAHDNGSIVACASKYIYYSSNLKRRDPIGTCWVSRGSFDGFLEYSPCRLYDQWGHHKLGSCQAGFSSAISKDGSQLFMGAPGAYVWQGQVFMHNLHTDLTNSTNSNNSLDDDDSYLGYSIALGKFSQRITFEYDSLSKPDVAVGVPRGADLVGKVVFVDNELRVLKNITGEQIGAYFGYSLVTADINGDGLDDLIVGAPFFNDDMKSKDIHGKTTYDVGRVYVALQDYRGNIEIIKKLDGYKSRGRFGTALTNCGDLNLDGIQDIAISAPYDGPDHHGAIYIYNGRRGNSELLQMFDQVIYASQLKGLDLRSFGWSMSGGLDMDNNSYPDLLIGDYISSKAILLKTRPIVNVTAELLIQPSYVNWEDKTCTLPNSNVTRVTCLTIQTCLQFNGKGIENRLRFVSKLILDATVRSGTPRALFLDNQLKSQEQIYAYASKDIQQCRSFKINLDPKLRDMLTPIDIVYEYDIADPIQNDLSMNDIDSIDSRNKLKPVINRNNLNRIEKSLNIIKHCGRDNVCYPDLKLLMSPNANEYIVGSDKDLNIDVSVKNSGENAFESMFYLTMPAMINYIGIRKADHNYPICHGTKLDVSGLNTLVCDLGNPQQRDEVVNFTVLTRPAKGLYSSLEFTFLGQVNSSNKEFSLKEEEDNQLVIGIPLDIHVDFEVSGFSSPSFITFNATEEIEFERNITFKPKTSEADIGPEINHIYKLTNNGPTIIHELLVDILWPNKREDGRFLLYLTEEPITSSKVYCTETINAVINPLNLKYERDLEIDIPNLKTRISSFNSNYNYSSQNISQLLNLSHKQRINHKAPYQIDVNNQRTNHTIRKRNVVHNDSSLFDLSHEIKATLITESPTQVTRSSIIKPKQVGNDMLCLQPQCVRFLCRITDINPNESQTIRVRSRLYKETLKYIMMADVDISSILVTKIKSLMKTLNTTYDNSISLRRKVVTHVYIVSNMRFTTIPWWIILAAILIGISTFVIITIILKHRGFFNRELCPISEAVVPTQEKTIDIRPSSRESINIWDEYKYEAGDTAL